MLTMHGGLETLLTAAFCHKGVVKLSWDKAHLKGKKSSVSRIRTAGQIIDDKFQEAERSGKVIRID